MRQIGPVILALVLVTCGGAPPPAASSATPPASPSATVASVATPTPTYAPSAEGFNSKLLVEKPRNYKTPAGQRATDGARFAYATPDIPPLAAGRYTESLRFVVIQTGGRSAAHLHSGVEAVLVLEGRVLVRSGLFAPTFFAAGEGFYMLPKIPVQVVNVGNAAARTLVYSITPEGAPFSIELEQSP
ncbi:MAG: cupin domain-containing protein [Chloroflexi bacterium]|nr:MAG: cupin domain-containing protein [Chloroflexota bacterium]